MQTLKLIYAMGITQDPLPSLSHLQCLLCKSLNTKETISNAPRNAIVGVIYVQTVQDHRIIVYG